MDFNGDFLNSLLYTIIHKLNLTVYSQQWRIEKIFRGGNKLKKASFLNIRLENGPPQFATVVRNISKLLPLTTSILLAFVIHTTYQGNQI